MQFEIKIFHFKPYKFKVIATNDKWPLIDYEVIGSNGSLFLRHERAEMNSTGGRHDDHWSVIGKPLSKLGLYSCIIAAIDAHEYNTAKKRP